MDKIKMLKNLIKGPTQVSEDAMLNKFLLSRGINPKFVSKDTKVSHAKSNAFRSWQMQHAQDAFKEDLDTKHTPTKERQTELNKSIRKNKEIRTDGIHGEKLHTEEADKKDTVTLDIPFLIRVLEFAREDAKTDMDLHKVVEKLIDIRGKGTLSMEDYDFVVSIKEEVDKIHEASARLRFADALRREREKRELKDASRLARQQQQTQEPKKEVKEDKFQDPCAATQTVGSEVDTDTVPSKKSQMSKSARIIKSIYKKKGVMKEDLYDHEKEDKGAKFGKKPYAAAVMKGGKTMTGSQRDTIEIDPMMRAKPGSLDPKKKTDK